jgi:hypothetical protein
LVFSVEVNSVEDIRNDDRKWEVNGNYKDHYWLLRKNEELVALYT